MNHTKLQNHITHGSGEVKTICATAVLTALGVPVESFHYTGSIADGRRESILRRHGFAVRSRMSKLPKKATIGSARKAIKKMDEASGTMFMVCVKANGSRHCMLLDGQGKTVVDTAPRKVDKRQVTSIKAVFKN